MQVKLVGNEVTDRGPVSTDRQTHNSSSPAYAHKFMVFDNIVVNQFTTTPRYSLYPNLSRRDRARIWKGKVGRDLYLKGTETVFTWR